MNGKPVREPLIETERKRFEGYAADILGRMGLDLDSPGGKETPRRWIAALWEMTEGYDGDPKASTLFPVECPACPRFERTQVIEGPIQFTALCEHHVLPIRGSVRVAYLAAERLIGISKLTRIVRLYAKRFTTQERLSQQLADAIMSEIEPRGAAVHVEAVHACMQARGVREMSSRTETLVLRGEYDRNPAINPVFPLPEEFRSAFDTRPLPAASREFPLLEERP